MDIVGIIIGLILGAIAYFVAGLFLPYIIAVLIGIAVFLLYVFGGGSRLYGSRRV